MSAVIVSLRVAVSPREAFAAFTRDIGVWWRPNPLFPIAPLGDGALRFEAGENGRLLTRLDNGEDYEIGRVTAWSPGELLAFTWRPAGITPEQTTHVEVRFQGIGNETRVTVEHRGWDRIPQEHAARHGFPLTLFQMRLAEHWRALLNAMSARI